jgi:EAL and modified HD-GYP domain-containing signal transduction protein
MVLGRNVASAGAGSLRALADLSTGELSFDEVERVVADDVGLSLKLLRYVNSAFFALPRTINTVHEALALLGSRTVQRWAMVVVMADAPDTPDELVALALLRARMCETLAKAIAPEEASTLFTVGLFSVADALLGMEMTDVLAELPFSPEIQAALLYHEGSKGRLLGAVLAYERGEFPELPEIAGGGVAGAYRDAVLWADDATRAARGRS